MDIRKIGIQALVGAILFTAISVILDGNYGQKTWMAKGLNGLLFGLVYALFLIVKEKFFKK